MKTLFTFLLLAVFALGVNAQLTQTFTFEEALADTGWTIFANGAAESVDDIRMFENPNKSGINLSDSVLLFIVHPDASPWAGMYTDHLVDPMAFTADDHILTMMVFKSIISPCAMKIERSPDGGVNQELKVPNTLTDEWELLTFDLSAAIGYTYNRLTVFPDFPDTRTGTEDAYVYMDNFSSPGAAVSVKQFSGIKTILYPNPAENIMFIQHPDMTGFAIANLLGQVVKTSKFQSVNSRFIEISDMKAGVYFISVESASGFYTSKFVKK